MSGQRMTARLEPLRPTSLREMQERWEEPQERIEPEPVTAREANQRARERAALERAREITKTREERFYEVLGALLGSLFVGSLVWFLFWWGLYYLRAFLTF